MYKLNKNMQGNVNSVTRLSDGACIPFDPQNVDYQAFLLWKSQGNTPTPAETT